MPSLTRFLNALSLYDYTTTSGAPSSSTAPQPVVSPDGQVTTYYLAEDLPPDPSSSGPLLRASHRLQARDIPPGSILFGLSHPLPHLNEAAAFFLTCLPDPIGFLAHAAALIRSHLNSGAASAGPLKWRHNIIRLTLEDEPGIAYTSGGEMHVSLHWAGDIMREVKRGDMEMLSAINEFKGVLLHELVHAVQNDGFGSAPVWLTESIADYVRLKSCLGPPHWRSAGQGHAEKGWEDGYDAGAQFLLWLVEDAEYDASKSTDVVDDHGYDSDLGGVVRPTATATSTVAPAPPQATRYPSHPPLPSPPPGINPTKNRPGPWPDFIRNLNAILENARYDEGLWVGLTGHAGGLEGLWAAYLGHYR